MIPRPERPDGFIPVHDPATGTFLFRYNPETREVLIAVSIRYGEKHRRVPVTVALDTIDGRSATKPASHSEQALDKLMAGVV